DVGLLATHVLGAHVDDAFEVQQCARRRGRAPVLAGAGLGDDPRLAHLPGEQRLTDRVVNLVGAGVVEVFAFEVDLMARGLAQPGRAVQRRWAPDVVTRERVALRDEAWVLTGLDPGQLQLGQRRHQRLGHVLAPVWAEPMLDRAHAGVDSGVAPGASGSGAGSGSGIDACVSPDPSGSRSGSDSGSGSGSGSGSRSGSGAVAAPAAANARSAS